MTEDQRTGPYPSAIKALYERLGPLDLPDNEKSGYPEEDFLARVHKFRTHYGFAVTETQNRLAVYEHDFRVLDIGCGNGAMIEAVTTYGHSFFGLDYVESLIRQASTRNPHAHFVLGDACRLPFANHTFHFAYSLGVLQTVKDRNRFLEEMVRVIIPGGTGLIEFLVHLTPVNVLARLVKYTVCWDRRNLADVLRSSVRNPSATRKPWEALPVNSVVSELRARGAKDIRLVSRRWGFVDPLFSYIQFTI